MDVLTSVIRYVPSVLQWLAIIFLGFLMLGAFREISHLETVVRSLGTSAVPPASSLHAGDHLPFDLEVPVPPRSFLLLLSYGCSGCVDICRRLDQADLGDWSAVALLVGSPIRVGDVALPPGMLEDGAPPIPPWFVTVRDPERERFRQLGASATPAVLALMGGRLIEQQVAPSAA